MNYVNAVKKGIAGAGYVSEQEIDLGFKFDREEDAAVTFLENSDTKKVAKNSSKKDNKNSFKDKSDMAKCVGTMYSNNVIWMNVLQLGAISRHKDKEGNIDLKSYKWCMEGKGFSEVGKEFISKTSQIKMKEMLPYAILWTFDKRRVGATGWFNPFEKMKREELIDRAMTEMENAIERNKKGNKGSFLDFVSVEQLNIGMFALSTWEEVNEYCSTRGVELEEVEDKYVEHEEKQMKFIVVFKKALEELKLKCVKNVSLGYLKAVGKISEIDGAIPAEEWCFIFKSWFLPDYRLDFRFTPWKQERKIKIAKDFTRVLSTGRIAWSREFIQCWPEKRLDEFREYFHIKSDDGKRALKGWVESTYSKDKWYDAVFDRKLSEDSWFEMSKRQIIECFMASDICEFLGVTNEGSSIYNIDFNQDFGEKTAIICIQQMLVEYCDLRIQMKGGRISKHEAVQDFEDWFMEDHQERTKAPEDQSGKGDTVKIVKFVTDQSLKKIVMISC